MKKLLCYFVFAVCCWNTAYGQEQPPDTARVTPFDLITAYYNGDEFTPFRRGNSYVGLAFTINDRRLINSQRLLDKVLDGRFRDYEITFKGGYFLWDYVQVGMNISYGRDKFSGKILDQNADSVQRESIASKGLFSPFLKLYFPLSKNERLSFFLENGMGFGFGNSLQRDTKNVDEITKMYVDEVYFSIGLSPGITFFAIENFAFEVQLNNLLGYEFQKTTTTANGVEESSRTTNNVNFTIDLLSLRLGLAYYINNR